MYMNFPQMRWYLYDNTSGKIILKHPYYRNLLVKCPYCDEWLWVEDYQAECCGKTFKTGFWEIHQVEPFGTHNRKSGRGWRSLRPFDRETDLQPGRR